MVFSSAAFLTLFLPLFLGIYYLTPPRWRSLVIVLGSYTFYAWWRVDFVLLFGGVTLFNYVISRQMVYSLNNRTEWLVSGLTGNLLVLGYFKYFNFGIDSLNALIVSLGGTPWQAWQVILPIGISFYIFQAISYQIDVYRGDTKPAENLLDFAAFIALFPQLIAGPVIRYKDIADQFRNRTHNWEKFNEGVIYFCAGFCKKVLIADTLGPLVDMLFAQPNPSLTESWLGALAYTAQLYYDFCGYSQMAIGLGLMMGFRFIENFNHPYISRSITEFWRRWHISLSTWLKDYLYIPLGGNRKGTVRTYIHLLLTMVLGGLWHGANWTFVLWGAWHGAILAAERALGAKRKNPYPRLLAWPLTFLFVLIGWVLFRSPDVATAGHIYAGMLGLHGFGVSDDLYWRITPLMLGTLAIAYAMAFLSPRYVQFKSKFEAGWAIRMPLWEQIILLLLFVIAFCKLFAQSHSPFLYFQF